MNDTDINFQQVLDEADCLYSAEAVNQAVRNMADKLTADLRDKNPIVLAVMNGGLILTGQLSPLLNFPLQIDYLHATRYRHDTVGGNLRWFKHPDINLTGRNVVIVDDILDEGNTLLEVIDYCKGVGATEVLTAVLVNKLHDRKADPTFKADYVGLEIPDRFIFGYGMDYKGYWRNANGIFAVKGL